MKKQDLIKQLQDIIEQLNVNYANHIYDCYGCCGCCHDYCNLTDSIQHQLNDIINKLGV